MTTTLSGAGLSGVRLKKKGGRVGRVVGASQRKQFWYFRNVDLVVGPGDAVVLLGSKPERLNMLMRVSAGLLPTDEGRVESTWPRIYATNFGGKAVRDLSVGQSIRMIAALYGLDDAAIEARFETFAEAAEVGKILHVPIDQTEKEIRQQICHAVALNTDPGLIVLDRTAYVGSTDYRLTCLPRIQRALDAGSGMIISTSRPEVVHAVGTQFFEVRAKGLVAMTRQQAVEALFEAKGKKQKKRRKKRRQQDEDPDPGLA